MISKNMNLKWMVLLALSSSAWADQEVIVCKKRSTVVRVNQVEGKLVLAEYRLKRGLEIQTVAPLEVAKRDSALTREIFQGRQFKLSVEVVGDEMAGEEESVEAAYENQVSGKNILRMSCSYQD